MSLRQAQRFEKVFIIVLLIIFGQSCTKITVKSTHDASKKSINLINKNNNKPYLKAHFENGDLIVYQDKWTLDTLNQTISGHAKRYDHNRKIINEGDLKLDYNKVILFETNMNSLDSEYERFVGSTVFVVADLGIGIYCAMNKKACFGSCPTFYINDNSDLQYADAEGFSQAILPSLEYADIDALGKITVRDNKFSLTMKNEALETHSIRKLQLLAFPIQENERVYQSVEDKFYLSKSTHHLAKALGPEGNIKELLNSSDRIERISLADSNDINTKEEIYLEFKRNSEEKDLALFVNFRQSLLTTYLIYNAMAYMGDEVTEIFTKVETNPEFMSKLNQGIKKELGEIEAYFWDEKNQDWRSIGSLYETGPIAFNRLILPFRAEFVNTEIKIKLIMTKGYWKIDQTALIGISRELEKNYLQVEEAFKNNHLSKETFDKIRSDSLALISMPGDEFKFTFNLPEKNKNYDLFLYSKGYYIEWMRESWLEDKNLLKLQLMLESPKDYLRLEAKAYKEYERTMEKQFWNSKIKKEILSYD